MSVAEEEEEAFHLDVFTIDKEFLKAARPQVRQAFKKFIGLMEAFAIRQFVKQFENSPLGRGKRERPIPLPPWLNRIAGVGPADGGLVLCNVPGKTGCAQCDGLVVK